MKNKWLDFQVKANYWIDSHLRLAVSLITVPYLIGFIVMYLFHSYVIFTIAAAFVISMVFIRNFSPLGQCIYSDRIKEYLLNRWLKRGYNQYVFITELEYYKIQIKCLTLDPTRYLLFTDDKTPTLDTYDSYWGEWSLSSVRPANEKELLFIEGQIKIAKVQK